MTTIRGGVVSTPGYDELVCTTYGGNTYTEKNFPQISFSALYLILILSFPFSFPMKIHSALFNFSLGWLFSLSTEPEIRSIDSASKSLCNKTFQRQIKALRCVSVFYL